jgi:AcrR family transcriptional regulator
MHHFERDGFEACSVTDLAAKAGVTTGALYHHFGSKLGLYAVVRGDLENRVVDRMEGAAESVFGATPARAGATPGLRDVRSVVRAALLVAFDAAVRFNACRLLGEPPLPASGNTSVETRPVDPIETALRFYLPDRLAAGGAVLAAAWRAALLSVANGTAAEPARAALAFTLGDSGLLDLDAGAGSLRE